MTVKNQAAMEYLMTYGWAILVIAVVLGVLFQLGVFSSSSFSVRAPPGACQVFRPNGPGTVQNVNLMGMCSGQLPQYVSMYTRAASYSYVLVPDKASLNPASVSVALWLYAITPALSWQNPFSKMYGNANYGYEFNIDPSANLFFNVNNGAAGLGITTTNYAMSANRWYFAVGVYDSAASLLYLYINGVPVGAPVAASIGALQDDGQPLFIGSRYQVYAGFNGMVSDVQVYNTTLSAEDVQLLYLEGIGGSPIKLQNLVGWWPLNGNANDYSGNNNNGAATRVSYNNQWLNGYIAPSK
jgi:hypothetical protein